MIANNNTPKWYPPRDPALSRGTGDAFKLLFDNVYALRDGQAEIAANISTINSNVSSLSGTVTSLASASANSNANTTPANINGPGPVLRPSLTLEVGGTLASSQALQNLIPGNFTSITDGGNGNITFACTISVTAPLHANSNGSAGTISFDGTGNFYFCYAANNWARIGAAGYNNTF